MHVVSQFQNVMCKISYMMYDVFTFANLNWKINLFVICYILQSHFSTRFTILKAPLKSDYMFSFKKLLFY